MIFVEKKNFLKNFGDFAKNCPLNPMSLPPPPEFLKFSELAPPWREVPWWTLVLSLPETQFEFERNFNSSGRTLEDRRSRLSPENIDK